MARYVKISTIGSRNLVLGIDLDLNEAVQTMKEHLRRKVQEVLPDRPDLIVLPEVCDAPPNYPRERLFDFYEARGDSILTMFSEIAREHSCHIAYPRMRKLADGTWRNSVELIGRNGEIIGAYNKNHPTCGEISDFQVLSGNEAPILQCDFGTVGMAICFDLNFEQLRLQYEQSRPDLLVFVSMYHGGIMQQYWAYSCTAHFVSAISNSYPSQIISPLGHVLRTNTNYFDSFTETVNLDCVVCHLDGHWEKLEAIKKKYGSKIRIFEPGNLGTVQISSESDEFTIQTIVQEFELELARDYFQRSLEFQTIPEHVGTLNG
ncbi:carbon-nitrogen hydrolase family protein [Paenibacillus eucommiae]|uniref:Amidohydrolase n=1 Tax=Paenibacillus eucommiae TaxID=1355755 RepID=A0ABS4IUJ0_9BACL|nr:carbon-nitrogen hydrolase family protein [Paenibacillus eucommiae]MBP1990676.1 putative amidohydrolase [Paenibacillus eucommiae]